MTRNSCRHNNLREYEILICKSMDKTADEIAYERYMRGIYSYADYLDVCANEDSQPLTRQNFAES